MSFFRPEVFEEKKSSLWGTVLIKPSQFYKRAFEVIIVTTLLFVLLLFFGSYYTKETVHGVIEPRDGLVSLYAPQTGYLEKLFIHQGDHVENNTLIMTIASKQRLDHGVDYDQVLRNQLQEDEARLLIRGQQLDQELALKKREHDVLTEQAKLSLSALEQQWPLQLKLTETMRLQLERLAQVYAKGSIAKVQLERAEQDYHIATKELITIENQIKQLKNKINHEQLSLDQLQNDFEEKKLSWEQQLAELRKKLVEIDRHSLTVIHAPFAGLVTQLDLKIGQFVRVGQHLVDLKKNDDVFVAKLFVPSQSIGLIKVGQRVSMRVQAFPHEHYGTVLGHVNLITDSLYQGGQTQHAEALYIVYVTLDQQAMKSDGSFPLKQGMIIDADIKTQEMTLVQKILEPLYRLRAS
jgi:membrane fusion protein